jgi:hypothetical protein
MPLLLLLLLLLDKLHLLAKKRRTIRLRLTFREEGEPLLGSLAELLRDLNVLHEIAVAASYEQYSSLVVDESALTGRPLALAPEHRALAPRIVRKSPLVLDVCTVVGGVAGFLYLLSFVMGGEKTVRRAIRKLVRKLFPPRTGLDDVKERLREGALVNWIKGRLRARDPKDIHVQVIVRMQKAHLKPYRVQIILEEKDQPSDHLNLSEVEIPEWYSSWTGGGREGS